MTGVDDERPRGRPGDLAGERLVLTVDLTGDRVVAESVILEVRALARRFGLELPNVALTQQPGIVAKTEVAGSGAVPGA